ncbi:hypothetical protein ACET76_02550 [Aeromonas caviae]|uniref:hypothetical protein n=1 Tax=Aeromonas TaxID=642 RepID=UPI00259ED6D2|nr:hypothetical protein [Aeromonas rivipollensis]MDM5083757.1 hypothetical protein [Aeromonas rivipollensis]MDM5096135.1 hypothetical protein [Aeromonas rivipollensis]MDM5104312.1 hypothetical protein [Aeromonas rivipollensis]
MINFLGSIALDSFYLTKVDFNTIDKDSLESGNISFGSKVTLMTPNEMPEDKIDYIKLNVEFEVDGKDDNGNELFKLSNEYEAFFRVLNNKTYFESDVKARSHYCFSLLYPYVMDDILLLLKRAGVDGVELPLSATLEDMIPAQ